MSNGEMIKELRDMSAEEDFDTETGIRLTLAALAGIKERMNKLENKMKYVLIALFIIIVGLTQEEFGMTSILAMLGIFK